MRNEATHGGRNRRLAWAVLVPATLALGACGAKQPAFVLPPLPSATTVAPGAPAETASTLRTIPRRTTTTVAAAVGAAASTAGPPPASMLDVAPPSAAAPTGIAVRLPATAAHPATSVPAAVVAGASTPRTGPAAGPTGPSSSTTTMAATPGAATLQVIAPGSRAVPEGPFDVMVSGATSYVLAALPAATCAVDAGRVVPLAAGDCVVRATAPGGPASDATVHIRRGDPTVTWQFGASTPFTYNTLALDLRSSSGAPVTASAAKGACKLVGSSSISFVVSTATSTSLLGPCSLTVTVAESPQWNGATVTLTTVTTRAPVTVAFDAPATAATSSFSVRVVLTQADRSLDALLAFSVVAGSPCSLNGSGALPDPATRTATIRVAGTAPASGWCVLRIVTDASGPAGLVTFTTPGCRWVWIGTGTPAATKPACPA